MLKQNTNWHRLANPDKTEGSLSSLTVEWLTTEQAAKYLAVSVGALRNMTSNGYIPYYKLAGRNRYLKAELHELLFRNRRGGYRGN